eukprot:185155-Amorphochlora_amoeboformis.AAC.1
MPCELSRRCTTPTASYVQGSEKTKSKYLIACQSYRRKYLTLKLISPLVANEHLLLEKDPRTFLDGPNRSLSAGESGDLGCVDVMPIRCRQCSLTWSQANSEHLVETTKPGEIGGDSD